MAMASEQNPTTMKEGTCVRNEVDQEVSNFLEETSPHRGLETLRGLEYERQSS